VNRREDAIEAVYAVLRTSAAADGVSRIDTLRLVAAVIVDVVGDIEDGGDVAHVVERHWALDEAERREVFG